MDRPRDGGDAQSLSSRLVDGLEKLALASKTRAWHDASAEGLSATQARILELLERRGAETGLRLSEIAEELAVTPATASDALRALEHKRLVVKGRAAHDARALAVRLTDPGAEVARRLRSLAGFLRDALRELGPDEQRQMLGALARILLRLQADARLPLARMCASCGSFRASVRPGAEAPHRCESAGVPLGLADLRFDCPDHVRADAATLAAHRRALLRGAP